MRYLLDTNIIAEPTKPQPQVLERLAQFASERQLNNSLQNWILLNSYS
jgi:predicted nucleic acid-binding protein